jgi:hypothetical protein
MTFDSAEAERMRYMVIIDKKAHARLAEVTTKHKLSQSDVLEQLLLHTDFDQWAERLDKARADKVRDRALRRTALGRLRNLKSADLQRLAGLSDEPEA